MFIAHEVLSGSLYDNPTVFQGVGPVAHLQGLSYILFYEKNSYTFLLVDPPDHRENILDKDLLIPHLNGDIPEDMQIAVTNINAINCEHILLRDRPQRPRGYLPPHEAFLQRLSGQS